jgi:hypothetical protein
MAACKEIEDIGDVASELTRIRDLLGVVYASVTSTDRDPSDIKDGLLWAVSDIEADVKRIIAGIQKIQEART